MLHDGLHSGYNTVKQKLKGITPTCLIVLGSGLNKVLSDVEVAVRLPYTEIPGIKCSTVSGHEGVLEIIKLEEKYIAVLRGRSHIYEGYTASEVVRLHRILALLGVKKAILTNAAGSTSLRHKPGEIMLLKDCINMTGQTPLSTDEARSLGETFVDMSEPFSSKLRKEIKKIAAQLKIKLKEGVYAWMHGPQYETAAEVKMMNKLGADLVGMSTVPEVLALRQMGIEVVGISTVTNYGTGVRAGKKLSHSEVKKVGRETSHKLDILLKSLIKII